MNETLLTESQRTCLRLVGAGMSSKEIAIQTGLSPRTVDQYVNVAAQILGASNRRDAARKLEILENEPLKKLQLKPGPIDPFPNPDTMEPANPNGEPQRSRLFGWVPPLGGARDELSVGRKMEQIVKAALLAAVAFGSIVASGAWLQSLFS